MVQPASLLRASLVALCVGSLLACAPAPSSLAVQLRTDLAPGREFDALTLVVTRDGGSARSIPLTVDTSRSYGRPARLVDVTGLDDGAYRVSLDVSVHGSVIQTQHRRLDVHGASVVTLVVTRDCAGVTCPSASAPAAEACLGGRCVDPRCGDPGAPACGSDCTSDAECPPATVACVTSRCVSGQCFAEADDTLCMPGEICDSELGCGGHALAAPTMRVPASGFSSGSPFDTDPAHPASPVYLAIRWLPVAGASEYEVQVDDSCALDTYESCAFPSPESSFRTTSVSVRPGPLAAQTSAPVGTRYFVRVRACAAAMGACGPFGPVRYVNVGRQRTDLDGDGYADVAIGHPDTPTWGAVHVYRGAAAGVHTSADFTLPGTTLRFGFAMAAADLDGDGYGDLAVTAHDLSFHGIVYLASGFAGTPSITHAIESPVAPMDQSFGHTLATGDLDADGYDDLAVGAPRLPGATSRGGVFVYRGGPSATWTTPDQTLALDDPAHGGFGRALAIGDLNGDGVMDLAVGAPDAPGGSSAGQGIVYVFFGRARASLDTLPSWTVLEPTGAADAAFGAALATGDLSGDGIVDLVIGSPQERVGGALQGAVYRIDGGSETAGALQRVPNPVAEASFFGSSVDVVRALSTDERGALAIGAPQHGGGMGLDYVVHGTDILSDATPTTSDGQLGWALASVGDVNGDGFDDLAIAAPMGFGNGSVYLRLGDVALSMGASLVSFTDPNGSATARFGWSIAR